MGAGVWVKVASPAVCNAVIKTPVASTGFTNVVVFQFSLVLVFAEFFSEDDDQVGRDLKKGLVGVSTKRRQSVQPVLWRP